MRPKIVILTLIVAFGVLGVAALFKGVSGKKAEPGNDLNPTVAADSPGAATNGQLPGLGINSTNTVVSEQMRAMIIAKAIEEIQNIQGQADGTNNPLVISALIAKMSHPELEVRKAALEAIKELNDTNAVSGLQQVAEVTKDPHEKVAVLDVIDYLNLPSATPVVPPDDYTNQLPTHSTNLNQGAMFRKKLKLVRPNPQAVQPPPTTAPSQ